MPAKTSGWMVAAIVTPATTGACGGAGRIENAPGAGGRTKVTVVDE